MICINRLWENSVRPKMPMKCQGMALTPQSRRILKKAVQQGRSERRGEACPLGYVEPLNDARTMLADFFSILLGLEAKTKQQGHTCAVFLRE
jgi:hypothetical protein